MSKTSKTGSDSVSSVDTTTVSGKLQYTTVLSKSQYTEAAATAADSSRVSDKNAYLEESLINGKLDINNDLLYKNAYLEKSLINGKLDINNDVVYKNAYWEKNINYDLDKSIVIVNNSPQRIVFSDDVVTRLAVSSDDSSSIEDGTQIGGHSSSIDDGTQIGGNSGSIEQIGGRDTQIGGQSDHIGGHGGHSYNSTNINVLYVQFQDDADTGGQSHTDDGGQSQTDDGGSPIHSNIGGQTVDDQSHTKVVEKEKKKEKSRSRMITVMDLLRTRLRRR